MDFSWPGPGEHPRALMPDTCLDNLLPAIKTPRLARSRQILATLASSPPQTLLLEGGDGEERLQMAVFWALCANCPEALARAAAGAPADPCLVCPVCRQFAAFENLDLLIFDGRISNRQDEDNPGPVRALRMENIRELKSILASAPHGDGKRTAVFQGMGQAREEAMNSLLKTLEEPTPHSLFVLLAPQRLQVLPTLVSRSFCLTLPWPLAGNGEPERPLEADLAAFLASGKGFLEKIAAKGALDAQTALELTNACQRALARILSGRGNASSLDASFGRAATNPALAASLIAWLAEAEAMLLEGVNPPRVFEALGSRIFLSLAGMDTAS